MIKTAQYQDIEKTAGYICILCGYPSIPVEKMKVLISFLRDQEGNSTLQELEDAFAALAAGRLDEKLESIKSLTGLTASRVLQSYKRNKKVKQDSVQQPDAGRSFLNDENRNLIYERFNRWVKYNDELTDQEKDYLMSYWVEQSRLNYNQHGKKELLTVGSFDYLERNGTIRIKDGMFQHFANNVYNDIYPWSEIEDGGKVLKYNDEMAIQRAMQDKGLRKMHLAPSRTNLSDAVKRYAVSVYFDQLI